MDEQGEHLFETDPSGALVSYKAGSIGAGRNVVMEVFEERYAENMDMEDAIVLGLRALKKATEEEKLNPRAVEIGIVRRAEAFRRMEESEVESYIGKANAS